MGQSLQRRTTEAERLVSVYEAAQRLGLRVSTLRAWIVQRRIGIVRLGRAVRIPLEEVERLIEEGTVPARRANGQHVRRAPRAAEGVLADAKAKAIHVGA